jgi:hypothetical protein
MWCTVHAGTSAELPGSGVSLPVPVMSVMSVKLWLTAVWLKRYGCGALGSRLHLCNNAVASKFLLYIAARHGNETVTLSGAGGPAVHAYRARPDRV